jgi:hypothetical protein
VQQALVQTSPTRIPNSATESSFTRVPDVPSLINSNITSRSTTVVRLRSILESTNEDEYQPYLWSQHDTDEWCYNSETSCRYDLYDRTLDLIGSSAYSGVDGSSLWLTPLLSDFTTGVYAEPQYAPRINTTVSYTNITATEWPSECKRDTNGIFFVEYHQDVHYTTNLVACIPTTISSSPWIATHNRQDITEELYLNISTSAGWSSGVGFYKATAKSSLGYFELPSVHNGHQAGPLLNKLNLSGVNDLGYKLRTRSLKRRETNDTYTGNVTQELGSNIGPLASLALALFGESSFIETRLADPSAYVVTQRPLKGPTEQRKFQSADFSDNCVSAMPLAYLIGLSQTVCWTDRESSSEDDIVSQANTLISYFASETSARMALTMGAFLANKAWLAPDGNDYAYRTSRSIIVDRGVPTIKTSISMVGIIVGSILLGAHLLGLLALALYTFNKKPFAPWLGAEIMVKAGTAYTEVLGAAEVDKQWKKAVSSCKGYIGDEKPSYDVGRMAFGTPAGLSTVRDRKYEGL